MNTARYCRSCSTQLLNSIQFEGEFYCPNIECEREGWAYPIEFTLSEPVVVPEPERVIHRRLFKVVIERTILVEADDDLDARCVALMAEGDAVSDNEPDQLDVFEIKTIQDIPREWLGALPYNSQSDLRTQDYIAKENQ